MAEIRHVFHIEAPFDKVFKAITTIEGLQKWWTHKTSGEDKVGEVIQFRFGGNAGMDFKVTELIPINYCKWVCVEGHPEWIKTEVSFELTETEGKVKVKFLHEGWKETTDFMGNCNFSWGRYLMSLKKYCENGVGEPYKD